MHTANLLFILTILILGSPADLKKSKLIGHWSLDGHAEDLSKYASHGGIFGDPTPTDGPIAGRALDFDGDDFIEIGIGGNSPEHFRDVSTGTISLWFKARPWAVDSTMLPILYYGRTEGCPDAFDATNEGLIIEVGHGGIFPSENVFFTCYDQPCAYPTMCFDSNDGAGRIVPNEWYHFVVVVGEDFNTGYLNGVELKDRRYNFDSESASLFFSDALAHDKLWIGKGYWKSKEVYFDGAIDDVRIYNAPLKAKDVQKLYKARI